MTNKFDIKDIILIGRTFDEYRRMFDLDVNKLKGAQILDAGGGVSSFTAEANAAGLSAKSSDRIYCFDHDELGRKCKTDLEQMFVTLKPVRHNYKWDFYGDEQGLRKYREKAYKTFLEDYNISKTKSYINTAFPNTVFLDKEFDITLMSHFLFLYDEHLDYNFHLDAISELIRITKEEIRIFPVANLRFQRSAFVDMIMKESRFSRVNFAIKKAGYEFIKGGNEYLSITI